MFIYIYICNYINYLYTYVLLRWFRFLSRDIGTAFLTEI